MTAYPSSVEEDEPAIYFTFVIEEPGKWSKMESIELKIGKRFPKTRFVRGGVEKRGGKTLLHVLAVFDSKTSSALFTSGKAFEGKFILKE